MDRLPAFTTGEVGGPGWFKAVSSYFGHFIIGKGLIDGVDLRGGEEMYFAPSVSHYVFRHTANRSGETEVFRQIAGESYDEPGDAFTDVFDGMKRSGRATDFVNKQPAW